MTDNFSRRQGINRPSAKVLDGRAETILERRKREKEEQEKVNTFVDYNKIFSDKLGKL